MNHRIQFVLAVLFALVSTSSVLAFPTPLTTRVVASGLHEPVFVTAPPGDNNRVFIVERSGAIRVLDLTSNLPTLLPTPFVTVPWVETTAECGLYSIAFHPDYLSNGRFYVYYSFLGFQNRIEAWTNSDPQGNVFGATASRPRLILEIDQYDVFHNAGWMAFGRDGYLFVAVGDGRGGIVSQTITNEWKGKILRIDVDGPDNIPGNDDDDQFPDDPNRNYSVPPDNPFVGIDGDDEIWAYGLRNPWRCSFDRLTGDLYIADVGSVYLEEINIQLASSQGGENYGWPCFEGDQPHSSSGPCATLHSDVRPVREFTQHAVGCAIIGGYVYRGPRIPDLQGRFFFAGYCSGRVFSVDTNGEDLKEHTQELVPTLPTPGPQIDAILSFGEDASGELYICAFNGRVYRIEVNCAGSTLVVTSQPQSQVACAGQTVTLSVAVDGMRGATTYAWRKNGETFGGDNNPTLILAGVSEIDAGQYDVVVQDQCGTAISAAATLVVNPSPPPPADINGDCEVDLVDASLLVDVLLGLDHDPDHIARSDINNDGTIDGEDIQPLLLILVP